MNTSVENIHMVSGLRGLRTFNYGRLRNSLQSNESKPGNGCVGDSQPADLTDWSGHHFGNDQYQVNCG